MQSGSLRRGGDMGSSGGENAGAWGVNCKRAWQFVVDRVVDKGKTNVLLVVKRMNANGGRSRSQGSEAETQHRASVFSLEDPTQLL